MELLTEVLRLLLPQQCAGCGAVDVTLCSHCRAALIGPARDARVLTGGLPPWWRGPSPRVVAVSRYEGPVRHVLVAWKDGGRTELAPVIGQAVARSVLGALRAAQHRDLLAGVTRVGLVPLPSAQSADRRRGGNVLRQALAAGLPVLAARAAERGVVVGEANGLRQRRGGRDQAGLGLRARSANMADRLTWRSSWTGPVILVDDVVTTGATLAGAADAIRRGGGGPVLAAAVVAATPGGRTRAAERRTGQAPGVPARQSAEPDVPPHSLD